MHLAADVGNGIRHVFRERRELLHLSTPATAIGGAKIGLMVGHGIGNPITIDGEGGVAPKVPCKDDCPSH